MSLVNWTVIEIDESEVPEDIFQELLTYTAEDCVDRIHGNYADLFIRHGDDGGWCCDIDDESPAKAWLEKIREEHNLPDHGWVFYLLIKTA